MEGRIFAGFVVRNGERLAGYVDSCPHAGWPLATFDDRYLTRDGRHILCTGLGALFTLDGAGGNDALRGPQPDALADRRARRRGFHGIARPALLPR